MPAFSSGSAALIAVCPQIDDGKINVFMFRHVQNMFCRQRFKIKPVGDFIIRAYCFRIVIDHNRFIPQLLQGQNAVDGAVIKFHSLTDADRA